MTSTLRRELKQLITDHWRTCGVYEDLFAHWARDYSSEEKERVNNAIDRFIEDEVDKILKLRGFALLKDADPMWAAAHGLPVSEEQAQKEKREKEVADNFERLMGYAPIDWWSDAKLTKLLRVLVTKTPEEIKAFAEWSKNPYNGCSPAKVRQNPQLAIDLWPQAQKRDISPNRPPIVTVRD